VTLKTVIGELTHLRQCASFSLPRILCFSLQTPSDLAPAQPKSLQTDHLHHRLQQDYWVSASRQPQVMVISATEPEPEAEVLLEAEPEVEAEV